MGWTYQSVNEPFTLAGLHAALGQILDAAPKLRNHEVWLTEESRLDRITEEKGGSRVFLTGPR